MRGRRKEISSAGSIDWPGAGETAIRTSSSDLESDCFSAEPRGRNPYVSRVLCGDREFRVGTEIRGIREKIDEGVRKMGSASEFCPTDYRQLGTLE